MAYPIYLKRKSIFLRQQGYSLKEIAEELQIAKSTASAWLSQIILTEKVLQKIENKKVAGRYKALLSKQKKIKQLEEENWQKAMLLLADISFSVNMLKLICALMWWCEGEKTTKYVRFTSSDKSLISNFLCIFRNGFKLDESKFRAVVHIHDYHVDQVQKNFWSDVLGIPLSQFYKSYQKQSTHIRLRDNYQGCVTVSYYDAKIAKELKALYNAFTENIPRGVR